VENATDSLAHALSADPVAADVVDHVAVSRPLPELAVVTLWRPEKRNAFSLAAWNRLAEVFTALSMEQDLLAVAVRGGAVFSAGADIEEFPRTRMTVDDAVAYNEKVAAALNAVQGVEVPVIAMLRGLAVGGGCELAAACDVRVASVETRLGVPIGRLGVTLGYTEARALAGLVGGAQLKRILFEGQLLDAQEALQIGLVEICVPDPDLASRTARLLIAILQAAPVTIRAAKAVADMCNRPLTAHDTERLVRFTVEAYPGPDLREGVAAFLGGRTPKFGPYWEEPTHVSP
jgi:enoyl-CoA hydratase